ncbi:hypothetical protein GNF80_16175 [Clostridium perfringens]|nr:hypothetical protein [Clostridium perfringens]
MNKTEYLELDKKVKLNDIEFNFLSLGNFKLGSLITIFVDNIDRELSEEITKTYSIKLKSNEFEEIYKLDRLIAFNEIAIK